MKKTFVLFGIFFVSVVCGLIISVFSTFVAYQYVAQITCDAKIAHHESRYQQSEAQILTLYHQCVKYCVQANKEWIDDASSTKEENEDVAKSICNVACTP